MHEVCREIGEVFGISISPPTICRLLHSYGITRKKIALQQSYSLSGSFRALFDPDVFLLTGADHRDHIRRYGYALRRTSPEYTRRFFGHGRRINAMIGINSVGVIAMEITPPSVNTNMFFDFVRGYLIPNMQHRSICCNGQSVTVHAKRWDKLAKKVFQRYFSKTFCKCRQCRIQFCRLISPFRVDSLFIMLIMLLGSSIKLAFLYFQGTIEPQNHITTEG